LELFVAKDKLFNGHMVNAIYKSLDKHKSLRLMYVLLAKYLIN